MEDEVADEGDVEQALRLLPERVVGMLLVTSGVVYEALYEFEDVGLVAEVGEGVVVRRMGEIYGVPRLTTVVPLGSVTK